MAVILIAALIAVSGCGRGQEQELELTGEEAAEEARADASMAQDEVGTIGSREELGLPPDPEDSLSDEDELDEAEPGA